MKNERLFQILYLLLEKKTMTAPILAEKLEVSVRTVYRDIEALSMAGIPVYATQGKGGGIGILPEYTFDKSMLSGKEQDQILFALQSLQATGTNVESTLSKLGGIFHKTDTDWIEVDFSRWGRQEIDNDRFELIKEAILEKKVLHIKYCGTNGSISMRKIEPLKLVFKAKEWYVQAHCRMADNLRIFKMTRIMELKDTEEHFTRQYDTLPMLEPAEEQTQGDILLKIRFKKEASFRVFDEFKREEIEVDENGDLLVQAKMPYSEWIYSFLLSYGELAEILEPQEQREAFKESIKRLKKIYSL